MDKRYLESPAHRQYIRTLLETQRVRIKALQDEIVDRDVEVTHVMLELAQANQKCTDELLTKLLAQ